MFRENSGEEQTVFQGHGLERRFAFSLANFFHRAAILAGPLDYIVVPGCFSIVEDERAPGAVPFPQPLKDLKSASCSGAEARLFSPRTSVVASVFQHLQKPPLRR